MGQPVDGKSGCHFVPTFRSQCTIIVYKSVYLVYEKKWKKKTKYKCLQCSANIPLFFFCLYSSWRSDRRLSTDRRVCGRSPRVMAASVLQFSWQLRKFTIYADTHTHTNIHNMHVHTQYIGCC